jgi:cytochrome c peroxidase
MSSGFPFGGHPRPADDLARMKGALEDHEMPPSEYRLMHWSANPSAAERDSVISWIDESLRLLAAHGQYPFGLASEAPEPNQGKDKSDSSN